MTHGSLFSGIGGFDLAAEWMGWENKFHCEWNEFGQKVLHHYWPQAELFKDITKSDFKKYNGAIDIISGGFPCQPYSSAGKRLGKEDSRHLWPEMLRAIREIQPRWVVGENVRGLTNWNGGLVFDEVQSELEAEGYEVTPFLLPACAVNAPHRRDRIWFVAFNSKSKRESKVGGICQRQNDESIGICKNGFVAYSDNTRSDIGLQTEREWSENDNRWEGQSRSKHRQNGNNGYATNTDCNGLNQCNGNNEINTSERRFDALGDINESNVNGYVADTNSRGLERSTEVGWDSKYVERKGEFGNATNTTTKRLEQTGNTGRLHEEKRDVGQERNKSSIDSTAIYSEQYATDTECRFMENKWNEQKSLGEENTRQSSRRFEHGDLQTNWSTFPKSEPTIRFGNDGISDRLDGITFPKWRNESIKAAGNAIVPQVVLNIFRAIEMYENI